MAELAKFIVCPNPDCRKFTLTAALYESAEGYQHGEKLVKKLEEWNLVPNSKAKTFPSFIPQAILDDYKEAKGKAHPRRLFP